MKTNIPKLMAALCAGALLLAGCGKKDDTLRLFVWSEYVPQSVIDKFTEETGIKVAVENYASNEEMLAKLLAGGGSYDLIQPSDYAVQGLVNDGELQELDHEKIPNLKNLAPEFRNMPFDPGNKYSVPWMAGFVGIVYNAEVVPGPVVGYRDVFTPEHAGRIVVLDDAREIVSWGLVTEGLPINDVSSANLAKIRPLLTDWLSKVKVYDSDSPRTPMLSGDTDIGVVWSGEGALLFEENPKFQWVMPEGVHMFVDNLAPEKLEEQGQGRGIHQLHPAPRHQQDDLGRFPLLQPERRGPQAPQRRPAQQPCQLSARIRRDQGRNFLRHRGAGLGG